MLCTGTLNIDAVQLLMSHTIVLKLEQHVMLSRVLFLEVITAVSIQIMTYSNVTLYSQVN